MTGPSDRILDGLGETLRAQAGPHLVDVVEAFADPMAPADALLAPTPRGWPAAFDLDHTPNPAWLGSAIGSPAPAAATVEEAREYVRDRPYWRRGTVRAMQAAVAAHLTGLRRVHLIERDGSPWRLRVRVYAEDVPAGVSNATLTAAATAQKPVGIILTVEIAAGASYEHLALDAATYPAAAAMWPTYTAMTNHTPEETP